MALLTSTPSSQRLVVTGHAADEEVQQESFFAIGVPVFSSLTFLFQALKAIQVSVRESGVNRLSYLMNANRKSSDAYRAVHPPSIKIVSPVINDAAGEARNTTAPATSIGSPIRCSAAIRSTVSA